jgi:hypothetical protein
MSTVVSKNVQIGADGTASNNFTAYQPATPDGTLRIGNGNSGSVTDAITLTSAGSVGIGTSSPSTTIDINGGTKNQVAIFRSTDAIATIGFADNTTPLTGNLSYVTIGAEGNSMVFNTNLNERMKIDSSGNLGLGVTPSGWRTVTKGFQIGVQGFVSGNTANQGTRIGTNAYVNSSNAETYIATDAASYYQQFQGSHTWLSAPSGTAGAAISFTQAMTLDASGNLLVGTTTQNTVGVTLDADGYIYVNRDGDTVAFFDRDTSDGDIVKFRKNGTTVGSIGINGRLTVDGASDGTGIYLGANDLVPRRSGSNVDATVNLGNAAGRFKDLYLSGGVYVGGTAAANLLDDYEEGTWTASYTNGTITAQTCTYTKIGRVVTAIFTIQFTSTSTLFGTISGLPFSVASNNYLSTHSREWYSTGKSTQCVTTTGATAFALYFYDNSQAVTNGGIYGVSATLVYYT